MIRFLNASISPISGRRFLERKEVTPMFDFLNIATAISTIALFVLELIKEIKPKLKDGVEKKKNKKNQR